MLHPLPNFPFKCFFDWSAGPSWVTSVCELILPYGDLEKPEYASYIKIRATHLVASLGVRARVLFPPPCPLCPAVLWSSGSHCSCWPAIQLSQLCNFHSFLALCQRLCVQEIKQWIKETKYPFLLGWGWGIRIVDPSACKMGCHCDFDLHFPNN